MNAISFFMKTSYGASNQPYANRVIGERPDCTLANQKDLRQKLRRLSERETEGTAAMAGVQSADVMANSLFSSSRSYGDTLRAQRQKAKDTSNKVKKLKYQFKDISSKILRSKTSATAKQVVSQARREVLRLKRAKQNGNYDSEEIEAAITHAKAMERVARKKAKHLEQEEMAEASGKLAEGNITAEEREKPAEEAKTEAVCSEAEAADEEYWSDEYADGEVAFEEVMGYEEAGGMEQSSMYDLELPDWFAQIGESAGNMDAIFSDMEVLTSEMLEELAEGMKEMLEEMGLDQLSDSPLAAGGNMDPENLKTLKIKHRNQEMKDIVKADAEYLKAVFEHLEKAKAGGAVQGTEGGASPAMPSLAVLPVGGSGPAPVIDITL